MAAPSPAAATLAAAAVPAAHGAAPAAAKGAHASPGGHGGPGAHGAHGGHGDAMHLPHGSIWPFIMALAIAAVGLGIVMFGASLRETLVSTTDPYSGYYFGDVSPLAMAGLGLAVAFLLFALVGWIREDYRWWFDNVGTGLHMPKAGTLLFIGSEVFLFGALFTTYFAFQAAATAHGHAWPDLNPVSVHEVHLPLGTTAIFTLFLFASSATIHKAELHLKRGEKRQFNTWWLATIVLGFIFLGGQVYEYATLISEGHTLGTSQFITVFFMLTGTHGLHVFGGLCVLMITYIRSVKGQFDERRHALPQSAAMYWHFVDIVWVVVFTVVYLLNAI